MKNLAHYLVFLLAMSILTGCKGGGDGNEPSENMGRFTLFATSDVEQSAKALGKTKGKEDENYDSILVTVIEVSVHTEENGWQVINDEEQQIDLIDLANDATIVLADRRLPPGEYQQIRLKFNDNSKIIVNGKEKDLKVPSGPQTGLKIRSKFTVEKGFVSKLTLKFDPNKSVVATGNGKFLLKPVVAVSDFEEDLSPPEIAIVEPNILYSSENSQQIRVEYSDSFIDQESFSILINGV